MRPCKWKSLKNDEKCFYFMLRAFFVLEIFTFLFWPFFVTQKNGLIKLRLISKFMTSQTVHQNWQYLYCLISQEINKKNSHRRCSVKKGVLRNLTKFTGKHLCQSLFFNRVAGAACNFIKKRFLHRCFPVNFAKIFKNTYFTKHLWTTASERLLGNEIWSVIKIRWGIFFFRNHAENEARRASSRPLFVL